MTTSQQSFIQASRELAASSPEDSLDFRAIIMAERGLECSQPDCPRFAMARVYRPGSGENTRVEAIAALIRGDLVSELRCPRCVEKEQCHVIEHLCPCGETAGWDVLLTPEMSAEVRSHYPSGLWNLNHTSLDRFTVRMCGNCVWDSDVRVSRHMDEHRPARRDRFIMARVFEVFHTLWTNSQDGYFPSISSVAEVITRETTPGRINHVASVFRWLESDAYRILHQVVDSLIMRVSENVDYAEQVVQEDIDEFREKFALHTTALTDALARQQDTSPALFWGPDADDTAHDVRASRRMLAPTSSASRGARRTLRALRGLR